MSKFFYSSCCLIALFSLKPVLADNLYLQQVKQVSVKKSDTKLHERIKNFQDRKRYTINNLPSFHKQKEKKQEAETLCQMCHGRLPHGKNSSIRAFLNQHSQRIDCLTCHYQPKNMVLSYTWSKPVVDTVPEKSDKPSKKIIPTSQNNSLLILAKHPFAQQTKESWDEGDLYQKERLHQQIHQPLSEIKLACNDCHQKTGLLDLQAFKFSPEEITKIETNRISRFLSELKSKDKNNADENEQRILLRGLLQ